MSKVNVYKWEPWKTVTLKDSPGPTRVSWDPPPEGWRPPGPVGFVPPEREHVSEPMSWEGDQA